LRVPCQVAKSERGPPDEAEPFVADDRGGHDDRRLAGQAQAIAEVDVLAVAEQPLVEPAHG
jgi:ferredoxin